MNLTVARTTEQKETTWKAAQWLQHCDKTSFMIISEKTNEDKENHPLPYIRVH
jgi:hypothetical protein